MRPGHTELWSASWSTDRVRDRRAGAPGRAAPCRRSVRPELDLSTPRTATPAWRDVTGIGDLSAGFGSVLHPALLLGLGGGLPAEAAVYGRRRRRRWRRGPWSPTSSSCTRARSARIRTRRRSRARTGRRGGEVPTPSPCRCSLTWSARDDQSVTDLRVVPTVRAARVPPERMSPQAPGSSPSTTLRRRPEDDENPSWSRSVSSCSGTQPCSIRRRSGRTTDLESSADEL
jgi:hypothetical protein